MKKLFRIVLVLIGITTVVYILTQRQSEARHLWEEALSKVPGPQGCCEKTDE